MSRVDDLLSKLQSARVVSFAKNGGGLKLGDGDIRYLHDLIVSAMELYYSCVSMPKSIVPTRFAYEVDAIDVHKIQAACEGFYNAMEPDANKEEP